MKGHNTFDFKVKVHGLNVQVSTGFNKRFRLTVTDVTSSGISISLEADTLEAAQEKFLKSCPNL